LEGGDQPTHKNVDTHIHTSFGIRTHDPRVRAIEDSTLLTDYNKVEMWVLTFLHSCRKKENLPIMLSNVCRP